MGTANSKLYGLIAVAGLGIIATSIIGNEDQSSISGIFNLGNTCFLNSLLQALSSCESFINFLTFLCQSVNGKNTNNRIVQQLKGFLLSLRNGTEALSPDSLISSLSEKFPHFGEQHDSHEIFYVIQDSISEVNKMVDNSFVFDLKIKNPFMGLISTEVCCSVCNHKSLTLETMFDISVSVTRSLEESLKILSKKELVEDVQCQGCSIRSSLDFISQHKSRNLGDSEAFDKKEEILKRSLEHRYSIDDTDLIVNQKQKAWLCHKIARFPKILCIHVK